MCIIWICASNSARASSQSSQVDHEKSLPGRRTRRFASLSTSINSLRSVAGEGIALVVTVGEDLPEASFLGFTESGRVHLFVCRDATLAIERHVSRKPSGKSSANVSFRADIYLYLKSSLGDVIDSKIVGLTIFDEPFAERDAVSERRDGQLLVSAPKR